MTPFLSGVIYDAGRGRVKSRGAVALQGSRLNRFVPHDPALRPNLEFVEKRYAMFRRAG